MGGWDPRWFSITGAESPARCRRDLEDVRLELGQERAKRQALQVSPGEGLPRARSHCPPLLTASPCRQRSSW